MFASAPVSEISILISLFVFVILSLDENPHEPCQYAGDSWYDPLNKFHEEYIRVSILIMTLLQVTEIL